jgi:HlyD family secretion protein
VKKGQILAELNTDMLKLQRDQQAAQVLKARANYELQQINYENLQKLAEKDLISGYELKSGKTAFDIQKAELSVAEANLRSIETEIYQYAFITSPVDGAVLERTVNEGDTVVDSSSANSKAVFTLAENLEEMRIEAWVGELDIASIFEGQPARFTLESLPGKTFSGVVESRRLMPSTQDNIVSYNIIIGVENKDGSLLPGMTCSVEFIVEQKENALLVPNTALRYQPSSLSAEEIGTLVFEASLANMTDEQKEAAKARREERLKQSETPPRSGGATQSGLSSLMGGGTRMGGPGGGFSQNTQNRQQSGVPQQTRTRETLKPLWFLGEDKRFQCVVVKIGSTDGSFTEIMEIEKEKTLEGRQIIAREKPL